MLRNTDWTGEGATQDQPQKEGENQRRSPDKPRGARVSRTAVRASELHTPPQSGFLNKH